jgi:hypothetical protein
MHRAYPPAQDFHDVVMHKLKDPNPHYNQYSRLDQLKYPNGYQCGSTRVSILHGGWLPTNDISDVRENLGKYNS